VVASLAAAMRHLGPQKSSVRRSSATRSLPCA
jgi:hypothetical protein